MTDVRADLPSVVAAPPDENTFTDDLYEWMGRAPFLAIALVAHLIVFLVLSAIPWHHGRTLDQVALTLVPAPPVDPFEEPQEPIEPDPDVETDVLLPEFEDVVLDPQEFDSEDEAQLDSKQSPFNSDRWNDAMGLGGAPGGGSGARAMRGSGGRPPAPRTQASVDRGLEWLRDHQADDGRWDCDGFMHDGRREGPLQDGAGDPLHDVGVTGLSLLAFMGIGDTLKQGTFRDTIRRGVAFLRSSQDRETGCLGSAGGHAHLYDHAIGALALCEALHGDPQNPTLRRSAQAAVDYISAARNPYGAWRYAVPPNGEQDTSVTGWMVFALAAARDVGLDVADADLRGALAWIDQMTDPDTGRTGYTRTGGQSSRPQHLVDDFPAAANEAMTAVGMLSRLFVSKALGTRERGDAELDEDALAKGSALLLETLPEWSEDGSTNDMYAWYYGSYAMFQYGARDERAWTAWRTAMERAILPHQRTEPATYAGSWDPIGPWGESGGRVYATATMVLCLEVYYRYGNLLGAR